MSGDAAALRTGQDSPVDPSSRLSRPVLLLLSVLWAVPAALALVGPARSWMLGLACAFFSLWLLYAAAFTPWRSPRAIARRREAAQSAGGDPRRAKLAHAVRGFRVVAIVSVVAAVFVGWTVLDDLRLRHDGIAVPVRVVGATVHTSARGNQSTTVCVSPFSDGAIVTGRCLSVRGGSPLAAGDVVVARVSGSDPDRVVLDVGLPDDTDLLTFLVAAAATCFAAARTFRAS